MIKSKIFVPLYKFAKSKMSGRGFRKYSVLRNANFFVMSSLKSNFAEVQGHKMFLGSKDSLRLSINGIYEEVETDFVKKVIQKGNIVIDVGANIGYYTLIFARLVGNEGKVFAFEPEPSNFNILNRNLQLNGYKNVIVEQKAISDNNGKIRLYISELTTGMHRTYPSKYCSKAFVDVDLIKLDDYFSKISLIDKINFIKIDVEGAEFGVLKGISNILKKSKDIKILIEFVPDSIIEYGSKPEDTIKLIKDLDFTIFAVDDQNKTIKKVKNYQEILHLFPNGTNLILTKDESL